MDLLSQGNTAFVDEDYEAALSLYTKALAAQPDSVDAYVARSAAYIKLDQHLEATEDASQALLLQPSHPKALVRRGEAQFHLEEYEAAKVSFEEAAAAGPGNASVKRWLAKCDAQLEAEGQAGMQSLHPTTPMAIPVRQLSQSQLAPTPASTPTAAAPRPVVPPFAIGPPAANAVDMSHAVGPSPLSSSSSAAHAAAQDGPPSDLSAGPAPGPASLAAAPGGRSSEAAEAASGAADGSAAAAAAAAEAPAPKYRHQFFQSPDWAEVAILAKRLTPERVSVSFEQQRLLVHIRDAEGQQEYELDAPLQGQIAPDRSKYTILSTKLEIRLAKAHPGHWPDLTPSGDSQPPNKVPAYPTSKRSVADWDKMASAVKKEEEEEKPDGEAGLQKMFRDIYSRSDEDTRRAMNKSFQESNGTVLSTNWKDIGAKKVTPHASK